MKFEEGGLGDIKSIGDINPTTNPVVSYSFSIARVVCPNSDTLP